MKKKKVETRSHQALRVFGDIKRQILETILQKGNTKQDYLEDRPASQLVHKEYE